MLNSELSAVCCLQQSFRGRLTAGRQVLVLEIGVRIPAPERGASHLRGSRQDSKALSVSASLRAASEQGEHREAGRREISFCYHVT